MIYILALTFMVLSIESIARDIQFSIPENSQLSSKQKEYGVSFIGGIELTGKYQFLYNEKSPYGAPVSLFVYPTKESIANLPFLTERGYPEYAEEIFIHNIEKAAIELLGKEAANLLLNGSTKAYTGEATFEIFDFWVSYECDSPSFTAKFDKLANTISIAKVDHEIDQLGC